MKKTLLMLLSLALIISTYAQPLPSAKDVEVTNYKEVLSQIVYPQICKEKGIEGKVIVSLEIDEQGNVISHEFVSFPCSDLKEVVYNSLAKFNFNPAVNDNGQTIKSRITMPVNFELTI